MVINTIHILRIVLIFSGMFILIMVMADETCAGIVHADSIRAAVIDTLTAYALRNDLDIEVSVPYAAHVVIKGIEDPLLHVSEPSGKNLRSRERVKVEFMDSERETIREIMVTARVKSFATVTVTESAVNPGDSIGKDDVVMKRMDITGKEGCFFSLSELDGMQAKRKLKPGTILTQKNAEPIPVVRHGDRVIIQARIGNVMITAEGTAREDGGLKESIRIYNEATRKTIKCTVIDSQTVLVGGEGG